MKSFLFFVLNIFFSAQILASTLSFPKIQSSEEIVALFPKNPEEISKLTAETLDSGQVALNQIRLGIQHKKPFDQTLKNFDALIGYLNMQNATLQSSFLLSPDEQMRKVAIESQLEIQRFLSQIFENEKKIYQSFKKNYPLFNRNFNESSYYLMKLILQEFELAGQNLSQEKKLKLSKLNEELVKLSTQFEENIQTDNRHFFTPKESLQGVHSSVLQNLGPNEKGEYKIGCDYPTVFSVMANCHDDRTRKQLYSNFNNRAFPDNITILEQIIEKRDQTAKLLGYKSYAHLSLSKEMAKEPKIVSAFLKTLWNKSAPKVQKEFQALSINLPQGVHLTNQGKLNSWDKMYSWMYYKKKHYNIDDQQIAEFFPLESTLTGLISIYEQFFAIQIEQKPIKGLWDPNIKLLQISETDGGLIGYIILDLFPRENKFNHACDLPGIVPPLVQNGIANPGLELVIANFTKPTKEDPSLLQHREVTTFFHEFGHALHSLFSKHEYVTFAGLGSPFMKYDFVELPSQMLEEWMWQPEILKQISSHYKTKKPLSDSQIQKLVYSKNMESGFQIQQQVYYSFLALNFFSEGAKKNISEISADLYQHLCPHFNEDKSSRHYLSFGHLTGYGPRYYGYLWSKVFALDIFEQIKSKGLLNPSAGLAYRKIILEKGASEDPNKLLYDFLGREPNQEAFIKELNFDFIDREKTAPHLLY